MLIQKKKNKAEFILCLLVFIGAFAGMLLSSIPSVRAESDFIAALRAKAEKGDPVAQEQIGVAYSIDAFGMGVSYDPHIALIWLRKSADQGYAPAQLDIGGMYEEGEGVKKDYTKAMKWYRLAADQGHPSAQWDIGRLYRYGEGVRQDWAKAYFWSCLAEVGFGLGETDSKFSSAEQRRIKNHNMSPMEKHLTSTQIKNIKEKVSAWLLHHKEVDQTTYGDKK